MSLTLDEQHARDEIVTVYDRLNVVRDRASCSGSSFVTEKLAQIIYTMDYVLRDFDFREAE